MEHEAKMGTNRTGIDMAPRLGSEMRDNEKTAPSSSGTAATLAAHRAHYIASASPIGSVPIPATLKGVATALAKKLTGTHPETILDKLGERLAFERTGTRLYESLIAKAEAAPNTPEGLLPILHRIRDDEAQHFRLLHETIRALGADPTAVTPSADVVAVTSLGILQVLADPRTTIGQSLAAILVAELADNAGWELLVQLADDSGSRTSGPRSSRLSSMRFAISRRSAAGTPGSCARTRASVPSFAPRAEPGGAAIRSTDVLHLSLSVGKPGTPSHRTMIAERDVKAGRWRLLQ